MMTEVKLVNNTEWIERIKEELKSGNTVILRVRGNSMYPFLHDYMDLVTLKPFMQEDGKPGNIVLFRCGEKYLLHRIIKKEGANYYLRGDNNWSFALEACREEDISALVIKIKRKGKVIACDDWNRKFLAAVWMYSHSLRVHFYRFYQGVIKKSSIEQ